MPSHSSMRPPHPIGQQLRRLSEWAVASSLSAALSCGSTEQESRAPKDAGVDASTDADVDVDASLGTPAQVIIADSLLFSTQPLSLPEPTYFALHMRRPGAETSELLSDIGDPCQDASDPAECFTRLDELIAGADCNMATKCRAFTLFQRGELIELQREPHELAKWLGDIDSNVEAMIAAMFHGLYAGRPTTTTVQQAADGYRVRSVWESCDSRGEQLIDVARDGSTDGFAVNMIYESRCISGRRPVGLVLPRAARGEPTLGQRLAEMAQLEAASVQAFVRLARELSELRAPEQLVRDALRSARDERRHTRQTTRLAARYGTSTARPLIRAPRAARRPLEIALENAAEGCVRESFGALIALHQGALAADAQIASSMRAIAQDELRHAELAWQVASWLEPKLSARERRLVAAARAGAVQQLAAELERDPLDERARKQLGWPSAAVQRGLLQRSASQLALC